MLNNTILKTLSGIKCPPSPRPSIPTLTILSWTHRKQRANRSYRHTFTDPSGEAGVCWSSIHAETVVGLAPDNSDQSI